MAQFTYKFNGDTPKRFQGRVIKPGDLIESDDEIINGEFEPTNAAAKAAQKATEAADAARADVHAKEREAAAQGLTLEEAFPELAAPVDAAPAPVVSAGKSTTKTAAAAATDAASS
jgi:hypothetical protein